MVETPRTIRPLVAAALLLAASALLVVASLERWVTASAGWSRTDRSIEDHLFDYLSPSDPWEPIGTAAQVAGVGLLLLAAGVLVLAIEIGAGRGTMARVIAVVAGAGAAAVTALHGAHTLGSGVAGVPTALQVVFVSGAGLAVLGVAVIGLGALAIVAWPTSPWWTFAALLLLGTTLPGYLVATFVIAPAIHGDTSFDTTPWTETVVAVWPALAAIAIVVGAVTGSRRSVAVTDGVALSPAESASR